MQMSELAPAAAEFDAAEPMRRDGDLRPACDFALDSGRDCVRHPFNLYYNGKADILSFAYCRVREQSILSSAGTAEKRREDL